MINEIINKYEHFSDSLIIKLVYIINDDSKVIEVTIRCMNKFKDYQFETIKLSFEDVISFRFIENENQSSFLINSALLLNEKGIITFDFFPLIFGRSKLSENENSDFKIKCRKVSYEQIE